MKRLLFAVCLLAGAANAQTPPPENCTEPEYRQFDFWLGDWSVTDEKGVKQGDNSITRTDNCLIVEHWKAASGNTGQSYNFFDPGLRQWRQVWVSGGNIIDYAGGLNDKGEMVLEGQIRYRDGHSAPFKGAWSKLADGSVRQHFEEFDNDKQQWVEWFTGIYKRRADR